MASYSTIPQLLREQKIYEFYSLYTCNKSENLFERCTTVLEKCQFNKEIFNLAKIHPNSAPEITLEIFRKLQNLRVIYPNLRRKLPDEQLVKKYQGFAQVLEGFTPLEILNTCYECQGNKSLFLKMHAMHQGKEDLISLNDKILRIVSRLSNLMTFSELKNYMLERSLTLDDLDLLTKQSLNQRDFRWKVRFGTEFSESLLINSCEDAIEHPHCINYTIRNVDYVSTFRFGWLPVFGHMMRQSVILGVACLKENKWDIKDLLDFFAFCRSTIAASMNHPPAPYRFGRKRSPSKISISPIVSCYSKMAEILFQLRDSSYFQISPESVHRSLRGIKGRFIYEDLVLEEVLIIFDPLANTYSGEVTHTRSRYFDKIYFKLQQLYVHYFTLHTHEEKLEILGQLFWWICRGKFWSQGESSIAEGTIKAIFMHTTGDELPPWKAQIIPWVEVMIQPNPDLFGKNFANLFDFSFDYKIKDDSNPIQQFNVLN